MSTDKNVKQHPPYNEIQRYAKADMRLFESPINHEKPHLETFRSPTYHQWTHLLVAVSWIDRHCLYRYNRPDKFARTIPVSYNVVEDSDRIDTKYLLKMGAPNTRKAPTRWFWGRRCWRPRECLIVFTNGSGGRYSEEMSPEWVF